MDLQEIIKGAREEMLTTGHVMPMAWLQLSTDTILVALDILDDTQSMPGQCGLLARHAWETGKKYPGQQPVAVVFTTEMWISQEKEQRDIQLRLRPGLDPKSQEIVRVEMWQAEKPHLQSYDLPVFRDSEQRVIEVGLAVEPKPRTSPQLASLVQGLKDSQRPDEEVFAQLDRNLDAQLKRLSPEQMKKLVQFLRQERLR